MSLKQTHIEYIIEQLSLKYLKDGIIPTSDMIEAAVATYKEDHPNLDDPVSKNIDLTVDRGSSSSAGKIHEIADLFSSDLSVITKEIFRLSQEGESFYDRWIAEIKRLGGKARELDDRIDSLLLLAYDSAGYFAHVGDVFSSMNKVDTSLTTAKVDLNETAVTINPMNTQVADGSLGTQLDLSSVLENDISFRPLSFRVGTRYSPINNSSLRNMFKTINSTWNGKIICPTAGEMSAELKVNFDRTKNQNISKVSFSYEGPDNAGNSTITLQYSADGHKWFLVPTTEATKALIPNTTWFFPTVEASWLKFIIYKPSYDDTSATFYEYQVRDIKVFGHNYSQNVGNIFVSNSQHAKDLEEQPVLFSTVALDTCEEIQDNTIIEYYVSASKDEETWTEWTRIEPSQRENTILPKVINFGGIDWITNEDSSTISLLNTNITGAGAQLKITKEFDNTSLVDLEGYKFIDDSGTFAVVNTAIVTPPNTPADMVNANIVVWRNMRNKTIFDSPDTYPDVVTVRGVPRGWGLNGSIYSCYFEIIDSNGRRLNFGDTVCAIDGSPATGSILVPQGIHKFETNASNWTDISQAIVDLDVTVSTEDTLITLDPLYPLNHKYIIEGFPYIIGFSGDKKYTGTDISAEFYAVKTSLFDLENNIQPTLGWFATRGVGTVTSGEDTSLIISVVLEVNSANQDYTNELCLVKWKTAAEDVGYKYARLKAELKTTDSKYTPILSSYRIKLGV